MSSSSSVSWDAAVRRLRRQVNSVALLDRVGVPLFCAGALSAFAVYLMRRTDLPAWYGVLAVAVLVAVCWVVAWFQARPSLFRDADSRAYLDEQLGLYGVLSASAGRRVSEVALPPFRHDVARSYRWVSFKPFYWMLGGAALVALGCLLPVSQPDAVRPPIVSVPPAMAQVEDWISELEQQQNIENESLEPFREQLNELSKKSREDMYTHSNLEASDALKAQMGNAMSSFGKDADKLNSALGEYQSELNKGNEANTQDLSDALNSLENSALKPGGQLAQQLAEIDPSTIRQMNPDQIRQLRDKLKQMSDCMNGMCQNPGMIPDPDEVGGNPGGDGLNPGDGGISRGRADAPLTFKGDETGAIDGEKERVESGDLSRAALGEQVGIQRSGHELDPERRHQVERTGAAAQPSKGGDAVWTDNVSPREREALRKVFN